MSSSIPTQSLRAQVIDTLIERDSASTAMARAQRNMNINGLLAWATPKFEVNAGQPPKRVFGPKFVSWFNQYKGNKQLCPCNNIEQASTWKIKQLEEQAANARLEYHFQKDRLAIAEATLKVLQAEMPEHESKLSLTELEALEATPVATGDDNRYATPGQRLDASVVSQDTADELAEAAIDNAVS